MFLTDSQLTVVMGLLLIMGFFTLNHQHKIRKKKEAFMAEQRKKMLGE